MGWLWSSGASPATPSPAGAAANTLKANAPAAPTSAPAATSQNDSADLEIARFLSQIQADFGSNSDRSSAQRPSTTTTTGDTSSSTSPPASAAPSSKSSSSWNFWGGSAAKTSSQPEPQLSSSSSMAAPQSTQPSTTRQQSQAQQQQQQPDCLDPVSESLLPTTMSCRQAFDTAFHCNSLGGQWTSVYRAGTVRSCSEHWDNFWFCMRTRAYSGEMKEEAIRDYYRQRELAKYHGPGKPNSTDVWEARTEKVEPGTAFQKRYVQPDISDEEWWQMEIEHRRKVQEELQRKDAASASHGAVTAP